jgi:hypothetical protein
VIAGAFQSVLKANGLDIVNRECLTLHELLPLLQQERPQYEQIVITDEGILEYDAYSLSSALKSLLIYLEQEGIKQQVILLTNNLLLKDIMIPQINIRFYYTLRITISQYLDISSSVIEKTKTKAVKSHFNPDVPEDAACVH